MDLNMSMDYDNLDNYLRDAKEKQALYDMTNDKNIENLLDEKQLNISNQDQSRKAFIKDLKQVIENSDVVLEVLDIRDPLSCRSKELESQILSQKDEKKIIILLNKMDLVPL
jgi:nuclear GTP-binding protein